MVKTTPNNPEFRSNWQQAWQSVTKPRIYPAPSLHHGILYRIICFSWEANGAQNEEKMCSTRSGKQSSALFVSPENSWCTKRDHWRGSCGPGRAARFKRSLARYIKLCRPRFVVQYRPLQQFCPPRPASTLTTKELSLRKSSAERRQQRKRCFAGKFWIGQFLYRRVLLSWKFRVDK